MTARLAALVLVAAATGCSSAADGLVPVSGSVKYADGAPATADTALVVFQPTSGDAKAASGAIDANGAFDLMTEKVGDGAARGEYKVVLKIWKDYRAQVLAVPDKYGDATTTPLTATVDAEHTHFDFVIDR